MIKHEFPLITVKWGDHFCTGTNEPHELKDIIKMAKPAIRETSGYLVYENKRMLAIAGTIEEDGTVTEVNFFIKRAILSRSDKD